MTFIITFFTANYITLNNLIRNVQSSIHFNSLRFMLVLQLIHFFFFIKLLQVKTITVQQLRWFK